MTPLQSSGRSLAQSVWSVPSLFTGMLSSTLKLMLNEDAVETLEPGDRLITNDPWMGTGHRPDGDATDADPGSVETFVAYGPWSIRLDDAYVFRDHLLRSPRGLFRTQVLSTLRGGEEV